VGHSLNSSTILLIDLPFNSDSYKEYNHRNTTTADSKQLDLSTNTLVPHPEHAA
jgi:hypothetical protein